MAVNDFPLLGSAIENDHYVNTYTNGLTLLKKSQINGDVNFPDIDWSDTHSGTPQEHILVFLDKIQDTFPYQPITCFTQYKRQNPSILDFLLTNKEGSRTGI